MSTLQEVNAANTDESPQADALREMMIGKLWEMGAIRSDRVAEVFRAVPRHLFAPGAPLEAVYAATDTVVVKRDEHGVTINTVTAPELQTFMLEQADLRPGMNADDGGPDDPHISDGVLGTQWAEVWSGVTIGGGESFETLQFWLATTFPGFCRLTADTDQGSCLVDPGNQWYDLTVLDGDSFAYLTTRKVGLRKAEFGVHAFGPHALAAAEAMAEQVRVWDRNRRGGPGPDFAVWPKDTPDERLPEGLIIDKRHTRVTICWPAVPGCRGSGGPARSGRLCA